MTAPHTPAPVHFTWLMGPADNPDPAPAALFGQHMAERAARLGAHAEKDRKPDQADMIGVARDAIRRLLEAVRVLQAGA